MSENNEVVEKKVMPPDVAALDSNLRMLMMAQNAPPNVVAKWGEFIDVVLEWKGGKQDVGKEQTAG